MLDSKTASIEKNKLIQSGLRELSRTNLVIDGIIGSKSLEAYVAFAEFIDYPIEKNPTRIEGELATKILNFASARYAVDSDYVKLAARLKVPVSYIRAVAEVETRDHAYLVDGRTTILFERHKFDNFLGNELKNASELARIAKQVQMEGKGAAEVLNAVRGAYPDICNPKPGGYVGLAGEYPRLERARQIDQEIAFKSASWGRFQIMGFNHKAAGYATATDMAIDYEVSEVNQLNSLGTFIINDPALHAALKRRDYAEFARRYNGAGYAKNKYDVRMAEAEARWAKAITA